MSICFFISPHFQPQRKRLNTSYSVPQWERTEKVSPLSVASITPHWVRHDGSGLDPTSNSPKSFNAYLSTTFVDSDMRVHALVNVTMLAFPDPSYFVAGQLHNHLSAWTDLAK